MSEGIEYVTLESALKALEHLAVQIDDDKDELIEEVKVLLVKRTFKPVGVAHDQPRSQGAYTFAAFKGTEVQAKDTVYIEVKS